jgi:hypothetical protein
VFTPLGVPHRPWALFQVAPVQLPMRRPDLGEAAVVRPGGINLPMPEVQTPPVLDRVTPGRVGAGGRVRIDVRSSAAVASVAVGGTLVAAAALTPLAPNGPYTLTLPAAVGVGTYDVRVRAGNLWSEPVTLVVAAATLPGLDAPTVASHPVTAALTLTGRAVGTAAELFAWPDGGVSHPGEVYALPVTAAAGSVTVTAADLTAANVRPGLYRVSARHSPHGFTPYVLLEFRA